MAVPSVSVVIPTYNEEHRIKEALTKVKQFLDTHGYDYRIIVSDDGSTDGTRARVRDFIEQEERVGLIENPHRGKGPTVKEGMLRAKSDYVLFTDADLATPIQELGRLLPLLTQDRIDIAIASREGASARRIGEPALRHFMGRVFNLVIRLLTLPAIQDTQCGFKLFRRNVAHEVFSRLVLYDNPAPLRVPYVGAFDVEVLLIAQLLGYKIREVPVTWTFSQTANVHCARDSLKMFCDVLRIRWNQAQGKYSTASCC